MWSASRSAPSSPLIGALFEATWQSLRGGCRHAKAATAQQAKRPGRVPA